MSEQDLQAALAEKNPPMKEKPVLQSDAGQISTVEMHDPGVTDISPLAGLPL
jgi:hypothetical protein